MINKASSLLFVLALSVGLPLTASAQQNSVLQLKEDVLRLKEAEDLFEKGFFEEALQKTQLVMNSKELNRAEKEQVLLITAKINLELDKIDEVKRNLTALLKTNPNYFLNPVIVQQDLYNIYRGYYVVPRLSFSIQGTGNIPLITGTDNYSILNDLDYDASYDQKNSFGAGLEFCYSFRYNYFLGAGGNFNNLKFSRTLNGSDSLKLTYTEGLSFFEIPVFAGKRFPVSSRHQVFATLMAQGSRLFVNTSKADISAYYPVYSTTNEKEILSFNEEGEKSINRKNERQNLYTYGVSLEINKRIRNLMIGIGGSYRLTNQNMNKPEERYSNQKLIYTYNYIDNDFSMDIRQLYVKLNYTIKYSIKHKQLKNQKMKMEEGSGADDSKKNIENNIQK